MIVRSVVYVTVVAVFGYLASRSSSSWPALMVFALLVYGYVIWKASKSWVKAATYLVATTLYLASWAFLVRANVSGWVLVGCWIAAIPIKLVVESLFYVDRDMNKNSNDTDAPV